MKTISGKVVSSNPISLSKAVKIMSGFASVDNGASDAVCMYLKRTSDAFNSLVQFHKEFKNPISHRTRNAASQPNVNTVKSETLADIVEIQEEKKVQKRIKNRDLEASQLPTVKKEEKKSQNYEFGSIKEDTEVIEQGVDDYSGKKKKKADKKERKQNKDPLSNCAATGVQTLEASDVNVKGEKIEYVDDAKKEIDGSSVIKREKKKKRKRTDDEAFEEKSSKVEDVKAEKVGDADDLKVVDVEKQDGKKKKKKRKRTDDEAFEEKSSKVEEDVKAENVGDADVLKAVDVEKQDGKKKRKKMKTEN